MAGKSFRVTGPPPKAFQDAVEKMAKELYLNHPTFNEDPVAEGTGGPIISFDEPEESIPVMPKRKIQDKTTEKEPIYTWAFKSSQARGGQFINYITQLNPDETLSCNCPGWIFSKGDKTTKACKHTRMVNESKVKDEKGKEIAEVANILKMVKTGNELPVFDMTSGETGFSVSAQLKSGEMRAKNSNIRHGRIIEI